MDGDRVRIHDYSGHPTEYWQLASQNTPVTVLVSKHTGYIVVPVTSDVHLSPTEVLGLIPVLKRAAWLGSAIQTVNAFD